jgi:predicted acylesterase/phospholipase RssA
MKSFCNLFLLPVLAFPLVFSGCGAVAGTVIDTSVDLVTYPFKEYVSFRAYKYDNDWDEPYLSLENRQKDNGEMLLGLCISGGGSRSAYFMACVLEELSKIPIEGEDGPTYLEEIDYISSVSGGSLASAYYCLKGFEGGRKKPEEFFPQFREAMQRNFELSSLARMALGWWVLDVFTYYDRADLIASVWDGHFFDGSTFADLEAAERYGSPTLIVNGTSLSNGLKFVFSTLPEDRFRSSYFDALGQESLIEHGIATDYQPFQTMGFQSLNSDIGPYRISKAVAASASVPNLVGPVTLRANESAGGLGLVKCAEGSLINVSDGGIYDNYGLESIMQVITGYLDRNPGEKAMIVVVDGSGFFDVDAGVKSDHYSVADFSERTLSISWLRAKNYMEHVLKQTRDFRDRNGQQPYSNLDFSLISLYDVLPSQQGTEYPFGVTDAAVRNVLRPDLMTKNFLSRLTTIQTRFRVTAEDAEAIEAAAARSATGALRPAVARE